MEAEEVEVDTKVYPLQAGERNDFWFKAWRMMTMHFVVKCDAPGCNGTTPEGTLFVNVLKTQVEGICQKCGRTLNAEVEFNIE